MAKFVLTDAFLSVNSVTLSDHVQKLTVETTRDDVDVTAMGASYKQYLGGLGDANVKVDFYNDFAAASVHATLYPLATTNTPFPVLCRPTSAVVSTTNPAFWLSCLMFGYTPLDGKVGDASTFSVEFRNNSALGLIVSTS
jgi:hypothetical protein